MLAQISCTGEPRRRIVLHKFAFVQSFVAEGRGDCLQTKCWLCRVLLERGGRRFVFTACKRLICLCTCKGALSCMYSKPRAAPNAIFILVVQSNNSVLLLCCCCCIRPLPNKWSWRLPLGDCSNTKSRSALQVVDNFSLSSCSSEEAAAAFLADSCTQYPFSLHKFLSCSCDSSCTSDLHSSKPCHQQKSTDPGWHQNHTLWRSLSLSHSLSLWICVCVCVSLSLSLSHSLSVWICVCVCVCVSLSLSLSLSISVSLFVLCGSLCSSLSLSVQPPC